MSMTMPPAFWDQPVTVRVPATSANLGPGFDSLGLALSLHDEVTAQVVTGGLVVTVEGEGADDVARDDSHLVVRSMRAAFDAMDASPGGLLVHCVNRIPHARGLGSSSAAIVAGLWAARALVVDGDVRLTDADLVDLAARIEGHPDNVAPCLLGGFTIAWTDAMGRAQAVSRAPHPPIEAMAFIPADGVTTATARGVLPESVPHGDAAFNAARTALLTAALLAPAAPSGSAAAPEALLLEATDDRLHQQQRAAAMPRSATLVTALRAEGIAAFISGAGPTVLALATQAATLDRARTVALSVAPDFTVEAVAVDLDGAVVTAG